jgi:molybdopterin-binding protein
MSREAIEDLRLAIGDIAVAVVKSTTVIVETPH